MEGRSISGVCGRPHLGQARWRGLDAQGLDDGLYRVGAVAGAPAAVAVDLELGDGVDDLEAPDDAAEGGVLAVQEERVNQCPTGVRAALDPPLPAAKGHNR